MINVNSVTKSFDGFVSVDNVSTCVPDGSIYGLIGSNGSGKSTLLRIMCGVYAPNIGEVVYDGEQVWENEAVKAQILYLSDESFFKPHSTAEDIKALYKCIWKNFSEEKYKKLRDAFGLDTKKKIGTFSKGMQKQTAVMLALAANPRYLLCDETFDGLDPVMRKLVKAIIADEVAAGDITTVIASHNLSELDEFADRIALLHRGKLIVNAELDDVKLGLHRLQAVFEDDSVLPEGLDAVSVERRGRLVTMVVRGSEESIRARVGRCAPVYVELLPLTLDEIFICEMEEKGYDATGLGIGK